MSKLWSENASAYLARRDLCPRCDYALARPDRCTHCNADLRSPVAEQIAVASTSVITALAVRQQFVDELPTLPPIVRPLQTAQPQPQAADAPARGEGSQISVQSVLATVGAALLAVAAIVFTFLNPDLTDFSTRTTIVAITTVIFLGGAWLLARAGLQFSAEAIGALGMVFVALDVWAVSHNAPDGVSAFVFAGLGALVASAAMIAIAIFVRIRTWLWLGLLGLASVPAWFGYAPGTTWSAVIGHLAVGFVALGVHEVARRLGRRFDSKLQADRWMATVVELLVLPVVVAQLLTLASQGNATRIAAALSVLAVLSLLSARNELRRFWSFATGAFFTFAVLQLVFALHLHDSNWLVALAPTGAAVAVVVLSALSRVNASAAARVSREGVLMGAMTVLLGTAGVGVATAVAEYAIQDAPFVSRTFGIAAALGLAAAAIGLAAIWRLGAHDVRPGLRRVNLVLSLSLGVVALISWTSWNGLAHYGQVGLAVAIAIVLSLALRFVPVARSARMSNRLPVLIGVHLLVIHAAIVSWSDPLLSQLGGAAIVIAVIAVTTAMPSMVRPVHTGVGFGYALIVFAHVLQLAHVETIAIFCLTTALASAAALGVTLLRGVPPRYWYAILIVTAVPFVIGIVDVLFVRSGWTALSTAVTFALALTLVGSTRPGLGRLLRGAAAALLMPALAVVVICLGAQVLRVSASPITLPIIAVIVACVLPSTELIGAVLTRRGISEPDAATSRLGIEISALVTAGLAVVLALVRAAAGLNTSLLVLLIIGVGAAASAMINHRRYGWIVAAASWTGALWCFWGTLGIQVLEPYLLPPAIAAAIVGGLSVLRRLPGVGLYSVGLACAVLPSLVVLLGWGNGAPTPWRMYGLVAGAAILLTLGWLFRKHAGTPIGSLATSTLLVSIAAAAGGAIEGARVALRLDLTWLTANQAVMFAALELGLLASVLAALGARLLVTRARLESRRWRWIYVPATIYLVVPPIIAIRSGWLSVWSMFGLTLVVLGILIATALRARSRLVALPPIWFLWLAAWCTAVGGWSDRALRVEAFSLPLGLALLAVGIIGMRGSSVPGRSLNSWPMGFVGSWRLLTPGIVVAFLPSILATGTDPQTLRAILVIALALVAILIGSLRRLGAPFLLGIIVLPIENITVFAAQIGHTISATSWWITLATAGAVLLVIAVTYERRSGGERGVAARIRDLR